ncbi:hypothetical protein FJR48_09355 [Sulfurimonas lithotrophica]|uniref:Uncharacterized protein n=1 Tax=Sulfurimonas lithotrophica TaxID=2590022 RepID=A0A5P8P2I1_9BACT|nr:hypothetical protein [Sulfurimonas lithotrophica]QFR49922.1 hypothetical protein FJR48_09355 [Sulfurimonas lithotrophica]
MIIIGHRFIPSFLQEHGSFYHIPNIEAIKNTPPNSYIFLEYSEENLDIIEHMRNNSISFCLKVEDITQIIYATNLGASFILVDRDLAKTAQDLANNYLFDAKILVNIDKDEDIEEFALLGIDGILYTDAIIKINS